MTITVKVGVQSEYFSSDRCVQDTRRALEMATQFVDPCLLLNRYRLSYVEGPGDCLELVICIVLLPAWPSTASDEEVLSTASLHWQTQLILGIT
jgi:hypothetical protein